MTSDVRRAGVAAHDAFFDELYERTTAPFLSPALAETEVAAFARLAEVKAGDAVLDLGCGAGRHAQALEARGLCVRGLERSARSVRQAVQNGLSHATRGDVRQLPYRAGAFRAVACFYSSLFFFDDEENRGALREVARVLAESGVFVLQTGNPHHLRQLGVGEFETVLPGLGVLRERTFFDASTGCEVGERSLQSPTGEVERGGYRIRHYDPSELARLAQSVGLELVDVRGDLFLAPWSKASPELVAVFRKMHVRV